MKKLGILLTTVVLVCCLVVLQAVPVYAETRGLEIVYGFDSEGNIVTSSPAVIMVYSEGTYVEASTADILSDDVVDYCLYVNDELYILDYLFTYDDIEISEFYLENENNELGLPKAGFAGQDEIVTGVYYDADVEERTFTIKITGYVEYDEYYAYDYEILDDLDDHWLPLAVVNSSGNVIAFAGFTGDLCTFAVDGSLFDAVVDTIDTPVEPVKPIDDGNNNNNYGSGTSRDPVDSDETDWAVIGGGIAAAVAIVVVIVVLASKAGKSKKIEDPIIPSSPYNPGNYYPQTPVGETQPIDEVNVFDGHNEEVTTPVNQPNRVTPVLYCEGGAMDGRRYELTAPSVVIGRASNCLICYPAETPGISREHCVILWKNGVLVLMDNSSSNGTYLRGKGKLVPMQPEPLKSGDIFYLGEKKNAFRLTFE